LAAVERGRLGSFAGVAVVSACVLMLQLTLTRLFSATMYYHFAFLAISVALFGSAASGVLLYLGQERVSAVATGRLLSAAAALFAVATVAALLVVLGNPISPVEPAATTFARLARVYAATAVAFLCAGGVISLAVMRFAADVSRLYLFDLSGAAAGCLLLIPVLDALGAVNTVLAVSVLATLAALVFARGTGLVWPVAVGALAAGLALLLADNLRTGRLDVRHAKGLDESGNVIFSRWNSFSRVTVWGSLANDTALIMIDADAATEVTRGGSDLARHAHLGERVESLGWHLRPGAKALILGPGGGNDVIAARLFGAREITAVEVNPIIARDLMSQEPLRSYSGRLFEQPGVRLVVDEARSFIRGSRERYDLIQGTMVDTWAATAAGAFALTENHLYTVEAFRDYLAHLTPDGILSMTRWYLEPPDQLLRLAAVARTALEEEERGAVPAGAHVMVVRGPAEEGTDRAPATFLLKRAPFTPGEVERAEAVAERNGFGVLYSPRTRPPNAFTALLESPDLEALWAAMPRDLTPTRDNSPFFFHTARLRDLGAVLAGGEEWRKNNLGTFVLAGLLALTVLATGSFVAGPLALTRLGVLRRTRAPLRWLVYFACLGAGFIVVEVALVQKCILFLGHPTYSLAVVLFALLLFSGVGSRLSGAIPARDVGRRLLAVLAVVAVLVTAASVVLSPLFAALVHLARPWRIAVAVAALAPLGLAMGMPLPAAVRLLDREAPDMIPWAWGLNGAASVLGSVGALAVALSAGFNQALLTAAALYVAALGVVWSMRGRAFHQP
jgi:predicted membrane-bound spermidine synthase